MPSCTNWPCSVNCFKRDDGKITSVQLTQKNVIQKWPYWISMRSIYLANYFFPLGKKIRKLSITFLQNNLSLDIFKAISIFIYWHYQYLVELLCFSTVFFFLQLLFQSLFWILVVLTFSDLTSTYVGEHLNHTCSDEIPSCACFELATCNFPSRFLCWRKKNHCSFLSFSRYSWFWKLFLCA